MNDQIRALFPVTGLVLGPQWSALLMSASSIIVATNAVSLNRAEPRLAVTATSLSVRQSQAGDVP